MKFKLKYETFNSWKCTCKCRLRNSGEFVQGRFVGKIGHIITALHQRATGLLGPHGIASPHSSSISERSWSVEDNIIELLISDLNEIWFACYRNENLRWSHCPNARCRHQMETFSALLAFCAGNSPVIGEFPAQRPVTPSFDVLFDLCLNKRLSKQSRGWSFETTSRSLWPHGDGVTLLFKVPTYHPM